MRVKFDRDVKKHEVSVLEMKESMKDEKKDVKRGEEDDKLGHVFMFFLIFPFRQLNAIMFRNVKLG
ncbi:hypothetical protein AKG39_12600 [Acetobacterium bakii]|uniref:Uncharacterized protein n=1 Tax=Acetobacterium bakii TaxID=52689 RepID=A0A0L6U0H5_9FIRM|nr:hypothetical protein AKG39_12600 [Acetobacterium bakii]